MRRQTPIAHLLYAYLYPNPTPQDPPSFSAHLARNLVPEVRIEVATFYGDLNSAEARYPGLNYCYAPHRMRLGRFRHHKKLFDAFDNLGLTYNEIQEFCCWEGTKWARERYEKDEGITVIDTTGSEIGPYVDRRELRAQENRRQSITRKTDISVIVEGTGSASGSRQHPVVANDDEEMSDAVSDQEDEEESVEEAEARTQHVQEVVGRREQSMNERIIAAWEQGQQLPADIEQFIKEQTESGALSVTADLNAYLSRRRAAGYSALPSQPTPARRATAAPRAAA